MSRRLSLCIAHNSGPGGALRFIEETARRLARHDDVVVCNWGLEADPPLDGGRQLWLPAPDRSLPAPFHPFGDLVRSVIGSTRAARSIDRMKFDAVVMFACRWGQAPIGLRTLRTPAVYFAHEARRRSSERGYRPSGIERTGWRRSLWAVGSGVYDSVGGALDRRAMQAPVKFATSSHWTAANLRRTYGVEAVVIPPGVDTARFRPPADPVDRRAVLFVGALDPTKRPELAVRAVARITADRRPDLRLVYNRCSRTHVERLEHLAAELGVNLVHRHAISDEELVSEYQRAAVLVACAEAEPFGLTVPEASACGTPVVAVNEGGYRETVRHGRNGLLVAPTGQAIAAGIAATLERAALDHDAIAAEAVRQWSWERCADELRALCASVVSAAASSGEQRVVELGQRDRGTLE